MKLIILSYIPLARYALNKRCAFIRHIRLTTRLYGSGSDWNSGIVSVKYWEIVIQKSPDVEWLLGEEIF